MVSPAPNCASPPSGSSATNEVMDGPALLPNVPVNGGDTAFDTSDVSSMFWRFPPALTVRVSSPSTGRSATAKFSVSKMVINRVNVLSHSPV